VRGESSQVLSAWRWPLDDTGSRKGARRSTPCQISISSTTRPEWRAPQRRWTVALRRRAGQLEVIGVSEALARVLAAVRDGGPAEGLAEAAGLDPEAVAAARRTGLVASVPAA